LNDEGEKRDKPEVFEVDDRVLRIAVVESDGAVVVAWREGREQNGYPSAAGARKLLLLPSTLYDPSSPSQPFPLPVSRGGAQKIEVSTH